MRYLGWLLGSLLIAGVFCSPMVLAQAPMPDFDLEAHRGGRDENPENTLAAFRAALNLGVSTLELDLQLTKDEVLVVSHNDRLLWSLARDECGAWLQPGREPKISSLTLAELRRYNVGAVNPAAEAYWAEHGAAQTASDYEAVPTLAEVLALVQQSGKKTARLNIETKSYANRADNWPDPRTFVERVLEVVDEYGMEDRIILQSFDWRILVEMKRLRPDIVLSALTAPGYRRMDSAGKYPWLAGIDLADYDGDILLAAKSLGADIISPEYHEITGEYVNNAHALGLRVVPWTVDAPEDMERMIQFGVDGLITDRPTQLMRLLEQRKLKYSL